MTGSRAVQDGDEVPKDLPEYAVKVRNSIRRATPQVCPLCLQRVVGRVGSSHTIISANAGPLFLTLAELSGLLVAELCRPPGIVCVA